MRETRECEVFVCDICERRMLPIAWSRVVAQSIQVTPKRICFHHVVLDGVDGVKARETWTEIELGATGGLMHWHICANHPGDLIEFAARVASQVAQELDP